MWTKREHNLKTGVFYRLWLDFNQIKYVENGSLTAIPKVREIHLDNNKLKKVPPGLNNLKYLQVKHKYARNWNMEYT